MSDDKHYDDEDVKRALERETQDGAGEIPEGDGDYEGDDDE